MTSIFDDAKGLRDNFHLAGVYTNLGWAYLNTSNLIKAEEYLQKSLKISEESNIKSSIEQNYNYLAKVAEQRKDYKGALLFTQKSRYLADELNKEQNFQYINDIIIKYDTEKMTDRVNLLERERDIEKIKYRKNRNILIGSCVLLFLVTILSYFLYRQQSLQSEKRIVTLEQDIMRSQMNPHFVFNSLNSIKQYIISNEQKSAVYYLNKFAKLMRKILDASKIKEVYLEEEIETLKLYFSIENIRFENQIGFSINIDDNVSIDNVKVPSLILQPFIENAIWHGLSSKKGNKKIDIFIDKSSDKFVNIAIEDNGVGREKSAEIKGNKHIKRKSVGLTLTNERLKNFVKKFKNNYSLKFHDLKGHNNRAIGTRVVLQLPLK